MKTLKEVFSYVEIIPGVKNYFLSSDLPLDTRIVGLASQRRIATEYVNEFYLDDELLKQRSEGIRNTLSADAEINRDFRPVAFSGQLQYWLSYFNPGLRFAFIVILVVISLWALRIHPLRTGIMVTGFTASSLEILLLFIYQVLFGNLYLMAGFMILVFMAGLYAGVRLESIFNRPSLRLVITIQIIMALACLVILLSAVLIQSYSIPSWIVQSWHTILLLSIAVLAGMQYSCTSKVLSGSVVERSGSLYSADLLGSAAGCLVVSIWIIPSFGMENSIVLILLLNLFAAVWLFLQRRHVISV